jgi:hypothetical protein
VSAASWAKRKANPNFAAAKYVEEEALLQGDEAAEKEVESAMDKRFNRGEAASSSSGSGGNQPRDEKGRFASK